MSEADWWLCDSCQSLNSLSARKCYSCRKRKQKRAPRASQLLGYQPVVKRDGRVTLEMQLPPVASSRIQPVAAVTKPPPVREPARRSILAVAPRPPSGARISYRAIQPPPVVPPPHPSGAVERRDEPQPFDIQPVGPWSHWRDLLDVSAPDADRLRGAFAAAASAPASGAGPGGPVSAAGLAGAMKSAHNKRVGGGIAAIEWPTADLAPQHHKSAGG